MTVHIEYERDGGIDEVHRDEWDSKDGFVRAFNNPEAEPGVDSKIAIPINRVVRIDE